MGSNVRLVGTIPWDLIAKLPYVATVQFMLHYKVNKSKITEVGKCVRPIESLSELPYYVNSSNKINVPLLSTFNFPVLISQAWMLLSPQPEYTVLL